MNRMSFSWCVHEAPEHIRFLIDRYRFGPLRADYYDYLAALMEATRGRLTIKEIFQQDALRYGSGSVRGRLSLRWLTAYQRGGGDLYATWLDTFTLAELNLIRAAQHIGNDPLVRTLHELADVLRLMNKAGEIGRANV